MGRKGRSAWMGAFRRMLAMGCVAMVFTLGAFAASPALHGKLHGSSHDTSFDGCAVTLFAAGVSLSVPVMAQPPAMADWKEPRAFTSAEIHLESPRYLHQPERGPPAV